jgi:hypothetical protein
VTWQWSQLAWNRKPDELVFTAPKGGALRAQGFQRLVLTEAAASLGLEGVDPHALRHTAASLAIASGANVKVVQQMLGHKSATMTLDLYGHLFPDQLDQVADRLDAAARAVVYPGHHHPDIGGLRRHGKSPAGQGIFRCSPDGIRTRATALRGQRARPLHNGALAGRRVRRLRHATKPRGSQRIALGY